MQNKTIYITEFDLTRLRERLGRMVEDEGKEYLTGLEQELNRAEVVQQQQIPADVITMNTRVRLLDLETREEETFTLVFPEEADIAQGKISILAPVGTAMLGYRVGDIIEWKSPEGVRKYKVVEVLYQPEASGDYDL